MTKKIRIGITWGNTESVNLGVSALTYSIIYMVNQILEEENIDHELLIFGGQGKNEKIIKFEDKNIHIINIPSLYLINWKTVVKSIVFPFKYRVWKLFNLDIVMDLSEGDSFTDIYGQYRFNKMLKSKLFFNKWAKSQILLPQTIGPFNNKKNEDRAVSVMSKINRIICRDNLSFKYSAKFIPLEKLNETIDIAFSLPFKKVKRNNNKINVGINISGLLWYGGYTKNNQFNLTVNYKKLMLSIVNYFLEDKRVIIHFIPHVIPIENIIESDYAISENLHNKFPSTILPKRFIDPISAKSYISGLDFFIGARMHACIAAFSSGVPVLPLAYSRKFNGLFIDTLGYEHIGDCLNDNEEIIIEKMKSVFNNLQKIKNKIDITNDTIVKKKLNKLKTILRETINEQL